MHHRHHRDADGEAALVSQLRHALRVVEGARCSKLATVVDVPPDLLLAPESG